MMTPKEHGKLLNNWRISHGWTLVQAGKKLGMSKSVIHRTELGKCCPRRCALIALAIAAWQHSGEAKRYAKAVAP